MSLCLEAACKRKIWSGMLAKQFKRVRPSIINVIATVRLYALRSSKLIP
jgi:hypothetical protein